MEGVMAAASATLRRVGVFLPADTSLAEVCVTLLFVTGAIGSAANTDPTPYSKFSPDSKSPAGKTGVSKEASGVNLPSRVGMGMIYGLGTVASAVAMGSMAFAKHNSSGIGQGLVEVLADAVTLRSAGAMGAVASLLHFGKRELEVLFVHKYSGSMPAQSALFISAIYGIVGWALSHFASRSGLDEADAASPGGMTRRAVGASLFVAGMAINAYHHVLLARLRKPGSTKRYVVPQGGLFPLIACPHYLGEIIQWLGCAVALPTPMHIGWMLQGLAYLGTRAASTTAYYREKLGDEYPRDRKHLIPWLY